MMTKSDIEKYIFLSFPYIDKMALSRLLSDYGHPRSRLNVDLVKSFIDNLVSLHLLIKEVRIDFFCVYF